MKTNNDLIEVVLKRICFAEAELKHLRRVVESMRQPVADFPSPLTATAVKAGLYIADHQRRTAEEIAKALGIATSTFNKHIVPQLKAYGVINVGAGYEVGPTLALSHFVNALRTNDPAID